MNIKLVSSERIIPQSMICNSYNRICLRSLSTFGKEHKNMLAHAKEMMEYKNGQNSNISHSNISSQIRFSYVLSMSLTRKR